ncbi:uncharacterized protein LOC107226661 isoform X2 [Neodiprion lecontei]|uniref:Uncharacterized protein LOC107226661 isoform X2 n=1 Tax=Neodiprion lecontei TaxID=441921 RepID=A0ABM3G2J9_NEOLC|nr:uncharacterized protein LOC107226661 isoform X2 [Neodiprion lecontei]
MKLRRRCMQTLGVSVKQLRRKLIELTSRLLHVQAAKSRDMALVLCLKRSSLEERTPAEIFYSCASSPAFGVAYFTQMRSGRSLGGFAIKTYCILLPCYTYVMMLSVSGGMEVGSGGRGGRGGLGGSLQEDGPTSRVENDVVAATKDRAVRASSVRQDLALDLPPRLQLPDGEERPYGAHAGLHLRDPEQESEIYQKCVRPPPNRTVFDSESPPAYRSQAALLDTPDRIVRCHSAGSSLLKVFRKFPNSGSSTPSVIVPRRPTLSSYSESSSNLSNLSSLTVVPCETDETHQHV